MLRRIPEQAHATGIPPIVHDVLREAGTPLDDATRSHMEPLLGAELGAVRLHTDDAAARSAAAINAIAYTAGQHVVIPATRLDLGSIIGRELLAHELAHTIQQGMHLSSPPTSIAAANGNAEHQAENVAGLVARGARAPVVAAGRESANVARLAGPELIVTPQQIAVMRSLFQQVSAAMRAGTIAAEEATAITTAVAEAESAIVVASEAAAAGSTAIAAGRVAVGGATALAADDVTGIGVADDVAIPFVLLAAAAAFGVGYLVGRSATEISSAWAKAQTAVAQAVDLMRRALEKPSPQVSTAPPQTGQNPTSSNQPKTGRSPIPWSSPDIDERDRYRRCRTEVVGARGNHTCHDRFSAHVSHSQREWRVTTPEGQWKDFDGFGPDHVLYEVKTGYGRLLNKSEKDRQWREDRIRDMQEQSEDQLLIAERCGYPLVWVFNNPWVKDLMEGLVQVPVKYIPFDCKGDIDVER